MKLEQALEQLRRGARIRRHKAKKARTTKRRKRQARPMPAAVKVLATGITNPAEMLLLICRETAMPIDERSFDAPIAALKHHVPVRSFVASDHSLAEMMQFVCDEGGLTLILNERGELSCKREVRGVA